MFDYLIVGAGLFGATCAYELTRVGHSCLVIERRPHIAGNCYTQERDGIHVHMYGPHIFHTSNERVWKWINNFARFNGYRHRIKAKTGGRLYSFPINLETMRQVWNVQTAEEAERVLQQKKLAVADATTLEGWALQQVGRELYELFIKHYTEKQWGRPASALPASILKRIPIRMVADDSYFNDTFQGIPIGGYTAIFKQLLAGATVELGVDYLADRRRWDGLARQVIFTGAIDAFFDWRYGRLEYRSLRFAHEHVAVPDFQGMAIVNYTGREEAFTRIVEHKHFEGGRGDSTWITREYPAAYDDGAEPYYPIRDERNTTLYRRYRALAETDAYRHIIFGGRCAEYQYYDMHQVIASALKTVESLLDKAI